MLRLSARVQPSTRWLASIATLATLLLGGCSAGQQEVIYDKAIDFTRKYWICSSEKARKELNLNTDKDLKFLLKQTADWYKNNGWL